MGVSSRTDGFPQGADIVGSFYGPDLEEGCDFEELMQGGVPKAAPASR
jgi:hypothetical protein